MNYVILYTIFFFNVSFSYKKKEKQNKTSVALEVCRIINQDILNIKILLLTTSLYGTVIVTTYTFDDELGKNFAFNFYLTFTHSL